MTKKTFVTSGPLMDAVRKLDYKTQYKVCEAFYQMMREGVMGDDSEMCLIFHDRFEEINPVLLAMSMKELHFAVNDMDNAIYEIDIHYPATFNMIARTLTPLIK